MNPSRSLILSGKPPTFTDRPNLHNKYLPLPIKSNNYLPETDLNKDTCHFNKKKPLLPT